MAKNRYQEGKGLGLHLQGIRLLISVLEKFNRFSLVYEVSLEKKMGAMAFEQKNKKEEMKHISH